MKGTFMTTERTIVAVDDDPELLEFLKETLVNAGFAVFAKLSLDQ